MRIGVGELALDGLELVLLDQLALAVVADEVVELLLGLAGQRREILLVLAVRNEKKKKNEINNVLQRLLVGEKNNIC